uniref:HTH La-type RNA-binding domain-containing protein n=1 Tax=Aegilops tauschii subsp. strangulata TaxID=200361 RepID=A0A453BQG4_AEGTS
QKIVKQVEYQFSDINLVANEFLLKIMNKDSEGYVPLSVISSWKKIKSLGATNQMLVKALRTSTKLIVSDDGKKVRRRQPFTEKHKEELQVSDDHSGEFARGLIKKQPREGLQCRWKCEEHQDMPPPRA